LAKNRGDFLSNEEFAEMVEDTPYVKGECPTCGGELTYTHDEAEVECDCSQQQRLALRYHASGLPRLYQVLDEKNLFPHVRPYYDDLGDYMSNLDMVYRHGKGLLFHGVLGTGKTYLAALILKRAILAGYNGYFVQFTDLFLDWAESWKDPVAQRRYQRMKRADFLLLDDVLSDGRNQSGYLQSGLEAVVRHRHNQQLPTLVTTNMTPDDLFSEFPRASSVLSGTVQMIRVEGQDKRPERLTEIDWLVKNRETLPVV